MGIFTRMTCMHLLGALWFSSFACHGDAIRIDFSGVFIDFCDALPGLPGLSCAGDELSTLVGTEFNGSILLPSDLGPDLDPDDRDRGSYVIEPDRGYFRLDTAVSQFDLPGGQAFNVLVQDCQFTRACPAKENYVWISRWALAPGEFNYILLLNGLDGERGPDSDQLPSLERLREMARIGGNFEIDAWGFSEGVTTELRYVFDETYIPTLTPTVITFTPVPIPAISLVPGIVCLGLLARSRPSRMNRSG